MVELNRAVAVAMRDGPAAGLALIDAILARGELADYHLAHARGPICAAGWAGPPKPEPRTSGLCAGPARAGTAISGRPAGRAAVARLPAAAYGRELSSLPGRCRIAPPSSDSCIEAAKKPADLQPNQQQLMGAKLPGAVGQKEVFARCRSGDLPFDLLVEGQFRRRPVMLTINRNPQRAIESELERVIEPWPTTFSPPISRGPCSTRSWRCCSARWSKPTARPALRSRAFEVTGHEDLSPGIPRRRGMGFALRPGAQALVAESIAFADVLGPAATC